MEIIGIIASIIGIVTFLCGIYKWIAVKLIKSQGADNSVEKYGQTNIKEENPIELPPEAKDLAIREALRQTYFQKHGKPATRKDVDKMLTEADIISGTSQMTEEDLAEFEHMLKSEQGN